MTDFLRMSPEAARFVRRVSGAAVGSVVGHPQQPEPQAQRQAAVTIAALTSEQHPAVALKDQQKSQQQRRQEHLLPPAQELRFTPSPLVQPRQQLQRQPAAAGRQRLVLSPPPPPPNVQHQFWQQPRQTAAVPTGTSAEQQRFKRASGNAAEPIYSSEG